MKGPKPVWETGYGKPLGPYKVTYRCEATNDDPYIDEKIQATTRGRVIELLASLARRQQESSSVGATPKMQREDRPPSKIRKLPELALARLRMKGLAVMARQNGEDPKVVPSPEEWIAMCRKTGYQKKTRRYRCYYCRQFVPMWFISPDHVIPRVLGGKSNIENIVPACRPCNIGKNGSRTMLT